MPPGNVLFERNAGLYAKRSSKGEQAPGSICGKQHVRLAPPGQQADLAPTLSGAHSSGICAFSSPLSRSDSACRSLQALSGEHNPRFCSAAAKSTSIRRKMSLAASGSRPICAVRPGAATACAALRAPRVPLPLPARQCQQRPRLAVRAAASSSPAAAAPANVAADLEVLRRACKTKVRCPRLPPLQAALPLLPATAASVACNSAEQGISVPSPILTPCLSQDVPPEEVLAAIGRVEAAHKQQSLVQGGAEVWAEGCRAEGWTEEQQPAGVRPVLAPYCLSMGSAGG